jgi:hypothetical protein
LREELHQDRAADGHQPSAAAEKLADQILGIPAERTTKINADTAAANAAIRTTRPTSTT